MKRRLLIQIPVSGGAKLVRPDQQETLNLLMIVQLTVDEWDDGTVAKEIGLHVANKIPFIGHTTHFGEMCEKVLELVREKTAVPAMVAFNTPIVPGQISISYSVESEAVTLEQGELK